MTHFKKTISAVGLLLAMGATAPANAFSFDSFAKSVGNFFSGNATYGYGEYSRPGPRVSTIDYIGPRANPTRVVVRFVDPTSGLTYAKARGARVAKIAGADQWYLNTILGTPRKVTIGGKSLTGNQRYYNGHVEEPLGCGGSGTSC
jgi:hypothetical protein